MPSIALGLMSGTSADGVSAALGSFDGHHVKVLGHLTESYPPAIREKILKGPTLSASEVSQLNVEIGELFAHAANHLVKKLHAKPDQIDCIGSHGQTIYHGPSDSLRNTLQIGDAAVIAERTGIAVVSQFRQRDVAAGGQGAPLIPYFDQYFFGQGTVRAMQNIGGIGNVTIVGKGIAEPIAFDTGPGNSLMDRAIAIVTHGQESFDKNGARAKHGKIDMEAVGRMIQNEFFKRPPPKSTGPELFGEKFLLDHFSEKLRTNPDDVLATLNYFTCITIQEAYRSFVFKKYPIDEVIVSGGGTHNKTLMKKLECLFAPIPVKSIDDLGIPSQAKEPLAFAFLGLRALQGKPNHLPSTTGAKHARILGSITRA